MAAAASPASQSLQNSDFDNLLKQAVDLTNEACDQIQQISQTQSQQWIRIINVFNDTIINLVRNTDAEKRQTDNAIKISTYDDLGKRWAEIILQKRDIKESCGLILKKTDREDPDMMGLRESLGTMIETFDFKLQHSWGGLRKRRIREVNRNDSSLIAAIHWVKRQVIVDPELEDKTLREFGPSESRSSDSVEIPNEESDSDRQVE